MTSLLEGAKKLVTRGTDLSARVSALETAVAASRGHLDDAVLDPAADAVRRAGERLRLSPDHTVVALCGATGSGKSSTFNALVGLELASVGVRRPTTSWATACTWGPDGAAELLEWLGIPPRHQVVRDSMLDPRQAVKDLAGLVLLDLPDHDSTEVSHHLEVERLVKLADLLVWVLDPQKYADAAVHDRFLRPLAGHADVMLVVLNHIDEVPVDRRPGMIADLRRLLDADGLPGIEVVAASATEGTGIDELRAAIVTRIKGKAANRARMSTTITEAADAVAAASGLAKPPRLGEAEQTELRDALADAAGVPIVVEAVQKASLSRARRAVAWPVTGWMTRLRRDPLRRLDGDLRATGRELVAQARGAAQPATQIQRARVDTAVRGVADQVSEHLARPWARSVRTASAARMGELQDRLDTAVAGIDMRVAKPPLWAATVRVLQWALLLAALAGALWLGGIALSESLDISVPRRDVAGISIPLLLAAGGLGAGLILALLSRALVAGSARRRSRRVEARLLAAVGEVSEELVIGPVREVLDAYQTASDGLRAARG